ncbi:MAG: oligoendopeptidase F [Clostridiales Family XIII bacterium]|jgi:oligoendopeptidase F|nr:oligoendopeptidase F [Clostridiales Family XIII bacterium]
MGRSIKKRDEIDGRYKWDLASMYADDADWERDYALAEERAGAYGAFSGRLGECAATLLAAFEGKDDIWRIAENVYVYAHMRKDQDNRDRRYQAMSDRAQALLAKAAAAVSFFRPEFLEMPEDRIWAFVDEAPGLKTYEHLIRVLLREKAHVLSGGEERLLAQLSEVLGATGHIFSMLNNADMKFGTIRDEDGEDTELTHGRYIGFMESRDRRVRQEAFARMYEAYERQRNTLAATYSYNTRQDAVMARIRKHPSSLEAALSGDNVPVSVYESLLASVNGRLGALHRYLGVRRRLLGLDELHMYDLYAPIADSGGRKVPYEEGLDIMREGLAVLGEEYVGTASRGLAEGWVDVFENEGKTSGAYSFGSYDSKPFIMLNYSEKLKDVFTIAHEMGHSMHSWYSRGSQPFVYGGHSIFTAEVASTVNECLLMNHLLAKAKDTEEKRYLLSLYIDEFRTTLFRQAMFAEFEKATHEAVEGGGALTADWLSEAYMGLNRKYFGESAVCDGPIAMEWARIPHFYRAFYVYKYATGYSAAAAISKGLIEGGAEARDAYISFLKTGESDDPIELLKIAGVDMGRPEPVERAMDAFEGLVDELEALS